MNKRTSDENLGLENIKEGAAIERFNMVLAEVFENIQNPNMEATFQREINLKMVFKPTKNRDFVAIGFQVIPKLASKATITTNAAIGIDGRGKGFAREFVPMEQKKFPFEVTDIQKRQEESK